MYSILATGLLTVWTMFTASPASAGKFVISEPWLNDKHPAVATNTINGEYLVVADSGGQITATQLNRWGSKFGPPTPLKPYDTPSGGPVDPAGVAAHVQAKKEIEPRGKSTGDKAKEPAAGATLARLMRTVQEATAQEERAAAMDAFAEHEEEDVTKALAVSLGNRDPQVRDVALSLMEHMGDQAPAMLLAEMAVGDPDPDIRIRALQSLQATAPQALVDSVERSLEETSLGEDRMPSAGWGDPDEKRR